MNSKRKYLVILAALLTLGLASALGQTVTKQVRLSARANRVINGFEAELRGDYRASNSLQRLNAELENINLPIGTKVAFCVMQSGVDTLVGTGHVTVIGGVNVAEVELNTNDGDIVPALSAGDMLQSHQRSKAPFLAKPGCGAPSLIRSSFQ